MTLLWRDLSWTCGCQFDFTWRIEKDEVEFAFHDPDDAPCSGFCFVLSEESRRDRVFIEFDGGPVRSHGFHSIV